MEFSLYEATKKKKQRYWPKIKFKNNTILQAKQLETLKSKIKASSWITSIDKIVKTKHNNNRPTGLYIINI